MANPPPKGLVRGIHRWDLVAITINGIIGAGIFGLPAKVFALIGSYSLFAFVACALVVTLIILCFAEVSSRFDQTGGPYLYAREAFGPTVAFEVGWLIWLARLTAFAANCNLLVSYLGYFWPGATGVQKGIWRKNPSGWADITPAARPASTVRMHGCERLTRCWTRNCRKVQIWRA